MKDRQRTQGFTLIELLIVIAIIGILAAVLIPNLLGARNSANKRAIQAHSANVYKAMQAELAEKPSNTIANVIALYGANATDCLTLMTPTNTDTGTHYGWNKGPGAAASCAVTDGTTDFTVTVTGDGSTGTPAYVSVNGRAP